MANKNRSGNLVIHQRKQVDNLIDKIDRREKSGRNRENVDSSYNNFTINENGDKVWSF